MCNQVNPPWVKLTFLFLQCGVEFSGTYVEEVAEHMSTVWKIAQRNIAKAQVRQKTSHDKRAKEPGFCVGDVVLLHSPKDTTGPLRKLALPNKGSLV